jgi:pimeloyl-ACP methyl ester carboxylesterase
MRFDYYATGDSAGDCEELSLARMRLDVQQALQHCCDKTGVKQLTLVGVRLGATLAAQLASSCGEIESLVLYAPAFDGEALLGEWQRDQQAFHDKHSYQLQQTGANEVLGFTVPEKFQSELRRRFEPVAPGRALKRVLVLTDESDANSELVNRWVEMFNHQAIEVTLEVVENIAIWRREPMEAIVPAKTIRRIVKWIGEGQDA